MRKRHYGMRQSGGLGRKTPDLGRIELWRRYPKRKRQPKTG